MTDKKETYSIPFVNKGEEFEVPIIWVSDIRAMQMKRSKVEDPEFKELEASITLVHSLLSRLDKTIKVENVEQWEYSEFVKFVKILWEKNAANFRGILPNLAATTLEK